LFRSYITEGRFLAWFICKSTVELLFSKPNRNVSEFQESCRHNFSVRIFSIFGTSIPIGGLVDQSHCFVSQLQCCLSMMYELLIALLHLIDKHLAGCGY